MIISLPSLDPMGNARKEGMKERTDVQILRSLHNHAERHGGVKVELLMRVIQEADGSTRGGEWDEGSVA